MTLVLILGWILLVIIWMHEDLRIAGRIVAAQHWISTPARLLACQTVRQSWLQDKPYRRARYIAAAHFRDADGRDYVIDRITLARNSHPAVWRYVRDGYKGQQVSVCHPPERPHEGVLLEPSRMIIQGMWRLAIIVIMILIGGFIIGGLV